MTKPRHRLFPSPAILRGLILIATLAAIGFMIEEMGMKDALDTRWVDSEVRGKGLGGDALFVLAGGVFIAIGLPRQAVCFLAGYAFGFLEGLGWASLASLTGCVMAFFYARFMGRALVVNRFPERIARVDAFLEGNAFSMTLLMRLLPVGSNLLTNLAAGVSAVGAVPFLAGSFLGYLPQTAVFALLGSGIQVDPVFRIGASVILFVASGVIGVWLYRRNRRGRSLDAATEAALDGDDNEEDAA